MDYLSVLENVHRLILVLVVKHNQNMVFGKALIVDVNEYLFYTNILKIIYFREGEKIH